MGSGSSEVGAPPSRLAACRGYSLIELMVALGIIGAILAVALPSFLQSRIAVNENSAVSTLHAVIAVNEQYRVRFGAYADALTDLSDSGYLDRTVTDAEKAGYSFSYTGGRYNYTLNANPTNPGSSGNRYFYLDSGGVIRFSLTGPSTNTDSVIKD